MKILFISEKNPHSNTGWSGTPLRMLNALKSITNQVVYTNDYTPITFHIMRVFSYVLRKAFKINYNPRGSIIVSLEYKFYYQIVIFKLKPDIIFTSAASNIIAFISTNVPIIYSADATFCLLTKSYDNFANLTRFSKFEGNFIESCALRNAKLITYPSKWAYESAIVDYKIDESKLLISHWGPNLDLIPHKIRKLGLSNKKVINILFVGYDWIRKGGDLAYKAIKDARVLTGKDIRLNVCGALPDHLSSVSWVNLYGKLDKNVTADFNVLKNLYEMADIFILPSKGECYGMVLCEAAAYSLPIIASNTGGIPSIVVNGYNGYLVDNNPNQDFTHYSKLIAKLCSDDQKYLDMTEKSRILFENQLNWGAWIDCIKKRILNFS